MFHVHVHTYILTQWSLGLFKRLRDSRVGSPLVWSRKFHGTSCRKMYYSSEYVSSVEHVLRRTVSAARKGLAMHTNREKIFSAANMITRVKCCGIQNVNHRSAAATSNPLVERDTAVTFAPDATHPNVMGPTDHHP